ncbi:MAG: class I adenylate-forming enzyme family protein [Caulobacterales bacterium]
MFLLQQIHKTASATPRKIALVFNGSPLSYGTFWRFIDGCRRSLEPHLSGDGVALIWIDSLLESWIVDLAVRGLGVDTASIRSADQIGLFTSDEVACLITLGSEPGKDVATGPALKRLVLSNPSSQPVAIDGPLPPLPVADELGGHVSLTSGTTGRYKKVRNTAGDSQGPIEQRRLRYVELGEGFAAPDERTVVNIFNMGMWSAGGYSWPVFVWSLGGGVAIQQTADFERVFDWDGITHTLATPLYLSQLMALPEGAFPFRPQMQLIVVSGAVSPALARETMRRLTPRILVNLSSTETGGWARTLIQSDDDLRWYRLDPNRRVEVVDEADKPLAFGELGRVRVALREDSPTSYLNDPESTAAFFADGWFYPGDLGVLDGAGRLALYGRTSDIVHVDGVKYPAEPWERAIRDKLECEAVCVLSGNWRTGVEQLHVFIETRRPLPREAIDEALRTSLSGFAKYQAHLVESLPRTGTGKVRRIALAQQLHEGAFMAEPSQHHE